DQQEPVALLQLQRSQNTNSRRTNTFAYVWYLADKDEDIACGILVADVQPFVQSGGPMIIDPRRLFYERDFSKSLDASVVQVDGEMDWVNSHFRNRMDVLDGFYALLVGEWCGDDKIFQYWQKYFQKPNLNS
ncbi:SLC1A2, partial [Symbiodinium pilosum]